MPRALDYLEALGSQIGELGLPNRKYSSPLATGISSGLAGIAAGMKAKRGFESARKAQADKAAFESKYGLSYDLFVKLSGTAQEEILKSVGGAAEPELPMFGGRTLSQVKTLGAPSPTATVKGGSGAFGGLPDATVQTGPPLPPTDLLGKSGAAKAIDRYLGVGQGPTEAQQSLIDYRKDLLGIKRDESGIRKEILQSRKGLLDAQTTATRNLATRRADPDTPIEDWEVGVARRMGIGIPEGVIPKRKEFDRLLKYNRPAMAVLSQVDRLSALAFQAEQQLKRDLTDKEIAATVMRETAGLEALAGPNAVNIVRKALKQSLERMRLEPRIYNTPAPEEEDTVTADELPPEYDENEDDAFEPDDDEDDEDFGR